MQRIDEERLETDTHYRYEYLVDFIEFDAEDVSTIQASAMHIGPLVNTLVERLYEKLLAYDATARHFVPRQHGYDGPTPDGVDDLAANHEQIQFRKEHLQRYFLQLLGRAYDAKTGSFLDMVGKMHTPKAGNSQIDVPLVQMNALMGLLTDTIFEAVAELDLDAKTAIRVIRAYNKLMWIQNDFITRHYQPEKSAV